MNTILKFSNFNFILLCEKLFKQHILQMASTPNHADLAILLIGF